MALGAITKIDSYIVGNKRVKVVSVVLGTGANYPTGGEPFTASLVGLRRIVSVNALGVSRATSGGATARTVAYDRANQKLQIYTTGSAEAANNSDQSTITQELEVVGY